MAQDLIQFEVVGLQKREFLERLGDFKADEAMKERILGECTKRGTCPLDRKQFDKSFAGGDLTIQVRAAIDFAQQNDLAFGRSTGDQHFVFSRLAKLSETDASKQRGPSGKSSRRSNRRFRSKQQSRGPASRPFGRSF